MQSVYVVPNCHSHNQDHDCVRLDSSCGA
ncbi:hypothetical protein L195_g064137, partial [Trifolium pratense]